MDFSTTGNLFRISWDQVTSSIRINLPQVNNPHSSHQPHVDSTEPNQLSFISKHGSAGLLSFTSISPQTIAKTVVPITFIKMPLRPHANHVFTNVFLAPLQTIKLLVKVVSLDLTGHLSMGAVSATADTLTIGTLSLAGLAPLWMRTASLASIHTILPNPLQTTKQHSPQHPGRPPSSLITNAHSVKLIPS